MRILYCYTTRTTIRVTYFVILTLILCAISVLKYKLYLHNVENQNTYFTKTDFVRTAILKLYLKKDLDWENHIATTNNYKLWTKYEVLW